MMAPNVRNQPTVHVMYEGFTHARPIMLSIAPLIEFIFKRRVTSISLIYTYMNMLHHYMLHLGGGILGGQLVMLVGCTDQHGNDSLNAQGACANPDLEENVNFL